MSEQPTAPRLTGQFSKALVYAELKHHNQLRKGGDIPYVGHLLSVAGLVIGDNGSESQAIAALLHDCVEDAGGAATLEEIRANFGDDVARIVSECSDTDETPKPPWRDRKDSYIAHLAEVGDDTILVSLADKLDNARAILRDFRADGPQLWQRFTVKDPGRPPLVLRGAARRLPDPRRRKLDGGGTGSGSRRAHRPCDGWRTSRRSLTADGAASPSGRPHRPARRRPRRPAVHPAARPVRRGPGAGVGARHGALAQPTALARPGPRERPGRYLRGRDVPASTVADRRAHRHGGGRSMVAGCDGVAAARRHRRLPRRTVVHHTGRPPGPLRARRGEAAAPGHGATPSPAASPACSPPMPGNARSYSSTGSTGATDDLDRTCSGSPQLYRALLDRVEADPPPIRHAKTVTRLAESAPTCQSGCRCSATPGCPSPRSNCCTR